jgi:soluble lytic murein transglycosylase
MKFSRFRPQSKRRSTALSLSLMGLSTILVLTSHSAPAEATRPVVKTTSAIKNLKMSLPRPMDEVTKETFLGLDLEPAASRQLLISRANEYVNLRRGRLSAAQVQKWLDQCSKPGNADENPFCRYELDRRQITLRGRGQSPSSIDRSSAAADLKDGRYDKLVGQPYAVIGGAIKNLESSGQLQAIASRVADSSDCPPSIVSYAMAYKLEEQFPNSEVVDLAQKLYRRGAQCGADLYTAQSNFRLGLIQIWRNQCGEVQDIMAKVEAAPEARPFHARAKYWRHHCASVLNNEAAKKAARDSLLKDHPMSFHTLAIVGDDDALMSQVVAPEPPQAAVRSVVRPDLNGLIRGAEALIRAGSPHLAAEMLDRNVGDISSFEPEVRLYAAILLNRIGHALPKFKILASLFNDSPKMVSVQTMQLFFPLWYIKEVTSKQEQVDPLLIISLIRQESAFNKEARSIVGARGLMQVMPATARSVASVKTTKLYDPEINIGVGTKYFLKRLGQYGGDVELTLAAYNAGFARVEQWKRRYPTDNKMLFLDFIPFRETREYVSAILRNYYWYVKLYSPEQLRSTASVEGTKVNEVGMKVLAIMNANAGAAASLTEAK